MGRGAVLPRNDCFLTPGELDVESLGDPSGWTNGSLEDTQLAFGESICWDSVFFCLFHLMELSSAAGDEVVIDLLSGCYSIYLR